MAEKTSILSGIVGGLGEIFSQAVTDIRHKYEEVVWGRQVTDTPGSIHRNEREATIEAPTIGPASQAPLRTDEAAFRDRWQVNEPTRDDLAQHDRDDQAHDFDR